MACRWTGHSQNESIDAEAGTLGPKCTPMGQDLQETRWQGQGHNWQEHGAPGAVVEFGERNPIERHVFFFWVSCLKIIETLTTYQPKKSNVDVFLSLVQISDLNTLSSDQCTLEKRPIYAPIHRFG